MKLVSVYARFFRSLNFDFIKRSDPDYFALPWDATPSGVNYPFVELTLDPSITTVVGANEAGKSQVLAATKFGLSGTGFVQKDFCRYSPLFLTDPTMELPEFGVKFELDDPDDAAKLSALTDGASDDAGVQRIAIFHVNEQPKIRLYFLADGAWTQVAIKSMKDLAALGLPQVFEIDAKVPLPDAVPIDYLATGKIEQAFGRDALRERWDTARENPDWFSDATNVSKFASQIMSLFTTPSDPEPPVVAKYQLAEALLIEVAGLKRGLFSELAKAIRGGNAGYAKSIVDTINSELSRSLNFRHWWKQDDHFELFVEYQEYHLTFMIRDRTGRTYSFDERSGGLKYFLSYFVQYLSHTPRADGGPEILLMDEPDAYLSSSGQQDLLRIFEAFAFPDKEGVSPIQVMYVTHSPFLIDKNHVERLRVLEKGRNDEGTRVVENASRNHYEPLRSSIGEFVAETTFIGSCNLIVEGASDQVLIAGMSTWLRKQGTAYSKLLDLNSITMVPAGSAGHVPYMVFLARGRDVDKPAVVALLDADKAGNDAVAVLRRGGPRGKQLLAPEFILQLSSPELDALTSDNPAGVVGIEDLVPLGIAVEAVRRYAAEYVPEVDLTTFAPTAGNVFGGGKELLAGLAEAVVSETHHQGFHIDKIGFARHVCDVAKAGDAPEADLAKLKANFEILLAQLSVLQREAVRREGQVVIRDRVNRAKKRFMADHPDTARKEDVLLLIAEIASQLDDSQDAEDAAAEMRIWVREFRLEDNPRSPVDEYPKLLDALDNLAYLAVRKAEGVVPGDQELRDTNENAAINESATRVETKVGVDSSPNNDLPPTRPPVG